jgi:hypothetical protein
MGKFVEILPPAWSWHGPPRWQNLGVRKLLFTWKQFATNLLTSLWAHHKEETCNFGTDLSAGYITIDTEHNIFSLTYVTHLKESP